MCGRYSARSIQPVIQAFSPLSGMLDFAPRYNVAPSQEAAAIRASAGGAEVTRLKWGLVPMWAADPSIGSRLINARAETAVQKPAFRDALKRRRCLVPADGFYEWKKLGKGKQPVFIHRRDDQPFCFAGLWERWGDRSSPLETFTILTTAPNELMRPIHDRMPLILNRDAWQRWIDPSSPMEEILPLMKPYEDVGFVATPVNGHVNSPRNDDARCVEAMSDEPAAEMLPGF